MKSLLDNLNNLKNLSPKVKEKAIEIAIQLVKEKKISKKEALMEGIKQAEEWFTDLEG